MRKLLIVTTTCMIAFGAYMGFDGLQQMAASPTHDWNSLLTGATFVLGIGTVQGGMIAVVD